MNFLVKLLASAFFIGYIPLAPGTIATILAVFIFFYLPKFLWFYLFFLIVFTLFSLYIAEKAEKIFQNKDDRRIVIDEITGYFFTMFLIPPTGKFMVLGFLLFRLFDIVKPPYLGKKIQALPGGLGIVSDDIIAGIMANLVLQVIKSYI